MLLRSMTERRRPTDQISESKPAKAGSASEEGEWPKRIVIPVSLPTLYLPVLVGIPHKTAEITVCLESIRNKNLPFEIIMILSTHAQNSSLTLESTVDPHQPEQTWQQRRLHSEVSNLVQATTAVEVVSHCNAYLKKAKKSC